jgi:hypothetical protein
MDLAGIYRAEYGRCVATLTRLLGDINLAEEAVQDAFTTALQKWQTPPPNPGAWIMVTARNRAVDRLRRETTREARHAEALLLHQPDDPQEVGPVHDDQLRLIFTCCHPALAPDSRTALTLRLLGGLDLVRRCLRLTTGRLSMGGCCSAIPGSASQHQRRTRPGTRFTTPDARLLRPGRLSADRAGDEELSSKSLGPNSPTRLSAGAHCSAVTGSASKARLGVGCAGCSDLSRAILNKGFVASWQGHWRNRVRAGGL